MKIVILDAYTLNPGDLSWEKFEKLGELYVYDRTSRDEILERCKDAEIILDNKVVLDEEIISQLPKLRYIGILATGYNVVDIASAKKTRSYGMQRSELFHYGSRSAHLCAHS